MIRDETNDLKWDNRSVFWPSNSGAIPGGSSNLWMCAQDVETTIWSYFNRIKKTLSKPSEEPIRLENCSDSLKKILINSLPYRNYSTDLLGALGSFSQMVAQTLVLKGCIDFEIGVGWNKNSKQPKLEAVNLSYIPAKSLIRIGLQVFQVVPANANFDKLPARIIKLDPKRIIRFRLPKKWRHPLAKTRKQLPLVERSQHLWMDQLTIRRNREDFKTVTRKYNIQFARITAPIGWNARSLFNEEMANFQSVTRELQWHKFCVDIQNEILRTTDDVFKRIGQLYNETPHLIWQYLPTMEQIDDGLQLVINGEAKPYAVLKSLRGY
ncbi:MAG: hypothetical protein WC962_06045 [Phycisphaerae bacterium]|jgi:hypothetical protein